jgi:valine dehydrogenase (NAD+)
MRAGAAAVWGRPSLAGKRVGVSGVGKVGRHLVAHLIEDGARVVVGDVSAAAVAAIQRVHPEIEALDVRALPSAELDVYAPCALGSALDEAVVGGLQAQLVCGAANNQLAHAGIEKQLADRGVLYCPDYVVNAGGLIQVADEIEGFSFPRARARALGIFATTQAVLAEAKAAAVPPAVAADRLAERRMAEVGRLRQLLLP